MKNLIILIFVFVFLSCRTNSNKNTTSSFQIIGKISIIDNRVVYLKSTENGKTIVLDSTFLKHGRFEFNGVIKKPNIYGIFFDSIKGKIGFFMENSMITIRANKDNLNLSTIEGSKTHLEYLSYLEQSRVITSKINLLFPEFQKARAENDVKKLETINNKMKTINNENTTFILNYSRQHPNSYISSFALYSILRVPDIDKDTVSKIYNNFSNYVKTGDYSIQIANYLEYNK